MKVYLYCLFPPIDRFTRWLGAEFIDVHILLCVFCEKEKKNIYLGEGVALVVRLEIIPR